jgi:AcrR family transcriptional regulator
MDAPLDSPRRGRRELAKARNRAAILAAARQVFTEMGYGAASIRDIVRRTTLAPGTFYNYFPDKESIFRTLVEDSTRQVRQRVRAARDRARNLEEFVGGAYRAYFQFVADDRVTFELMRRNDAAIRALLGEPVLMAAAEELVEDLRAALDRGTLLGVDVEYLAAGMYGVAFEVAVRMVDRQPVDVEGATRFASTLFLAAIEAFRDEAGADAHRLARESHGGAPAHEPLR